MKRAPFPLTFLKFLTLGGPALLCAAAASASPTNLIDATYGLGAGSFELGSFVNGGGIVNGGGGGYMGVAPGDSTTITGWTVGGPGDGVDWLTPPIYGADTGNHTLDLQHLTSSSISTTIATTVGAKYTVSFVASASTVVGTSAEGLLSAGSLTNQAFSIARSASTGAPTWTPLSYQFTATGSSTTVKFTGTGDQIWHYGPVLDSVSVTAVPEPATDALMGAGLGIVVVSSRIARRRQA